MIPAGGIPAQEEAGSELKLSPHLWMGRWMGVWLCVEGVFHSEEVKAQVSCSPTQC